MFKPSRLQLNKDIPGVQEGRPGASRLYDPDPRYGHARLFTRGLEGRSIRVWNSGQDLIIVAAC